MSIRNRFLALLLPLLLVPMLIIGFSSYRQYRDSLEDRSKASAQTIAQSQMERIDGQLGMMDTVITQLKYSSNLKNYHSFRSSPDIDSQTNYRMIQYVDVELNGILNNFSGSIREMGLIWLDSNLYFQRGNAKAFTAAERDKICEQIETLKLTPNENKWIFDAEADANPVTLVTLFANGYNSQPIGVIVFWIDMNSLMPRYYNKTASQRSLLMTPEGNIVMDSWRELDSALCPWEDILALPNRCSGYDVRIGNVLYWAESVPSSVNGWRLVLLSDRDAVLGDVRGIPYTIFLGAVACCMVMFVSVLLLFNMIYRPIRELSRTMQRFGEGDLSIRAKENRRDEFGLLMSKYNEMANRIEQGKSQLIREQDEKKAIEYKFLNAQVMPHFLMNTLLTVKVLAKRGRAKQVEGLVRPLIDLLRVVNSPQLKVPLGEEVQYVRNYVDIIKTRYQTPITVSTEITPEAAAQEIPKFLLQPLAENSILHGFVEESIAPLISITAYVEGELLLITMADNGCGMTDSQIANLMSEDAGHSKSLKFSGIGVMNVGKRIQLEYGTQYGILFESQLGYGTKVLIRLPYLKDEKLADQGK